MVAIMKIVGSLMYKFLTTIYKDIIHKKHHK